jgi:hypothetical protein
MPDYAISTEPITKLSERQLKARIAFADFAAKKSVLEKLKKGKKVADLDKEDKELLAKTNTQESLQAKLDELQNELKEANEEAERISKKAKEPITSPINLKPTIIIPNDEIPAAQTPGGPPPKTPGGPPPKTPAAAAPLSIRSPKTPGSNENNRGSSISEPNQNGKDDLLEKILTGLWTTTVPSELSKEERIILKALKNYKGMINTLAKDKSGSSEFFKQLEMTREFYARSYLILEKHSKSENKEEFERYNIDEQKYKTYNEEHIKQFNEFILESYEKLVSAAAQNPKDRCKFHSDFNYELIPILQKFAEHEIGNFTADIFSTFLESKDTSDYGLHLDYLKHVNEINEDEINSNDKYTVAKKLMYDTYPLSFKLSYAFYFPLKPKHNLELEVAEASETTSAAVAPAAQEEPVAAAATPATVQAVAPAGNPVDKDGHKLPEGWLAFKDPSSGKEYYHNDSLNATTWTTPFPVIPEGYVGKQYMYDWNEHDSNGKKFYRQLSTGKTQWEPPSDVKRDVQTGTNPASIPKETVRKVKSKSSASKTVYTDPARLTETQFQTLKKGGSRKLRKMSNSKNRSAKKRSNL